MSRFRRGSHGPGSTPSPISASRFDGSATPSVARPAHRYPRPNVPRRRPCYAASKLPTRAPGTSPPRISDSGSNWNTLSGEHGHRRRNGDQAGPLDGQLKITTSTRKASDPLSCVLDVMATSDRTLDNDRYRSSLHASAFGDGGSEVTSIRTTVPLVFPPQRPLVRHALRTDSNHAVTYRRLRLQVG